MADPDGTAVFELRGADVVLVVMEGRVGAQAGRQIARQLSEVLKAGTPKKIFCDLEGMLDYHSDVRTHCTQALLSNIGNVAAVIVIARSKLARMGVAVANIALGGRIQVVESRSAFDAALRAATRQPRS